jgi:hypothetical protein
MIRENQNETVTVKIMSKILQLAVAFQPDTQIWLWPGLAMGVVSNSVLAVRREDPVHIMGTPGLKATCSCYVCAAEIWGTFPLGVRSAAHDFFGG